MLEQFLVCGRFLGTESVLELGHFHAEGAKYAMAARLGHARGRAALIASQVDEAGSPQAKVAHAFVRPAVEQALVACVDVVNQVEAGNLDTARSLTPRVDEAFDYLERMLQAAP